MSLVEKKSLMDENEIACEETRSTEISERFSGRGLASTVKRDTEAQIEREEKTRESDPEAYRLSSYSEEYITARYRHGKDLMSGEDLVEYFREARERHVKDADFSVELPSEALVNLGETDKPLKPTLLTEDRPTVKDRLVAMPQTVRELPARAIEKIRLSRGDWFDGRPADTRGETRRFPLSAFAAILAVATSLTLVVASSVMIYHGESKLNSLKMEVSNVSDEIFEMKNDLGAQTDLLAIRDVAVNEFGMVSESYVRQEYLLGDAEDSIVVYENEGEQMIGLGALLNALGIK